MDRKALYNLEYGVFLVSSKSGDRINACITNTCMQVANDPVRVAISVINQNYTCGMIKKSGFFALTLLDDTTHFDTIRRFGYQSGRDTDKFSDFVPSLDANGCPYLTWQACAVLQCRVTAAQDLGTHTLFIAEVQDAQVLSDRPPLTYADYQARVKPRPAENTPQKPIIAWKCRICGYVYEGPVLPDDFVCPVCGHDRSDFEPVYAS